MKITVETTLNTDIETAWKVWTEPEHIMKWYFASEDWHCPSATHDLKPGRAFTYRMAAKDGSMAFDFDGTFNSIKKNESISFTLADGREVDVQFLIDGKSITVKESFLPDKEYPEDQQRAGWQAILENFKAHAESL